MTDIVKQFLVTIAWIMCVALLAVLVSCATIPDPLVTTPAPEPAEPPSTTEHINPFYTTDSEISPREIFRWASVYRTMPNELGIYYIVAENPLLRLPIACSIKYILCLVDNTKMRLIGYAYYRDGQLELYELQSQHPTLDTGHFMRSSPTEHKREVIDFYLLKFLDLTRERI